MSDYVVDESRFIIPDEDETPTWFAEGSALPFGLTFSEKLDETDLWQLYVSADSKFLILAVVDSLGKKWIEQGLCKSDSLQQVSHNGQNYYLLFSPSSMRICRVSQVRAKGSLHTATAFYCALKNTRNHNLDDNLRDGIYCQYLSIILPVYSSIPKVADKALFLNILRGKNDPENLSSPEELPGGLPWFVCKKILKEHGFDVLDEELYLQSGEIADDFFELKPGTIVLGPLVIRPHYQVFDTDGDKYILLFDKLWAEALLTTTLVSQINISSVALDGKMVYALTFFKKHALEKLSDRVYGLDEHSLIELAQAVRRTRFACPKARLNDALYVQELGLMLPESFMDTNEGDNSLMQNIAWEGPFALAPVLDDIREDAIMIAGR